ncbi:MAG: hypothetical protein QXN59_02355, partial [Candidatus Micrarchaeaceae archaeon]
ILNNITKELSSRLRLDTKGAMLFSEFVYNLMHLAPHHSSRKIMGKPELDKATLSLLRSHGGDIAIRTSNNFSDLEEIKEALRTEGVKAEVVRVAGKDKILESDGEVVLYEDTPINAIISVAKHSSASSKIIQRPYNRFLGRIASMISKRISTIS